LLDDRYSADRGGEHPARRLQSPVLSRDRRPTGAHRARQRLARGGETAQAYLFPASLGPAAPAASAKLEARLEDLRRASRAKRCESAWRSHQTATA